MQPKDSTSKNLETLIRHALPKMSDNQMYDILRQRVKRPNHLEDILQSSEEMQDMAEKDNATDFKDMINKLQTETEEREDYTKDFATRWKNYDRWGGKGKRKAVKSRKTVAEVTEEWANDLMPKGHRLWRDRFCCRWQWVSGQDYMASRSWQKYGYIGSLRMLVQEAWDFEATTRMYMHIHGCA